MTEITQTNSLNEEDPSTQKIAYSIYILYILSLLLPLLSIVGIVLAYIFKNDAKFILKSHYQYLIRTFWIGLLYFTVSGILIFLVIGLVLLPITIIWWIIRAVKGLKSLMRNEDILKPTTWIF